VRGLMLQHMAKMPSLDVNFGLKSYSRSKVSWWNPASPRKCPERFCKANS
jgi:hypothetical protein